MRDGAASATEALLPEEDIAYVEEKALDFELSSHGGEVHLILKSFELGDAYSPTHADLLIIFPAGYPNANPDMFWTRPAVKLKSGSTPVQANVHQDFPSGRWQRWSRHLQNGWRPGIDGLRTYIAAVRIELTKGR